VVRLGGAAVGERRAAEHDARHERLEHEAAAERLGEDHRLDGRAAEAAAILRERDAEPAELGELRPMLAAEALGRGDDRGALRLRVVVGDEAVDAVLDERLVRESAKSNVVYTLEPRMRLAMMLRWISFEPA
jgi:regulator of protease activity HflC (stomatin/prohibitin superfamily)